MYRHKKAIKTNNLNVELIWIVEACNYRDPCSITSNIQYCPLQDQWLPIICNSHSQLAQQ